MRDVALRGLRLKIAGSYDPKVWMRRVVDARVAQGYSQRSLGFAMGYNSSGNVRPVEMDIEHVSLKRVKEVCDFLGLDVSLVAVKAVDKVEAVQKENVVPVRDEND